MTKPKLEVTYGRVDVSDSDDALRKHNSDDRIYVGVTTGRLKKEKRGEK